MNMSSQSTSGNKTNVQFIRANFKILSVSRDGVCKLKIQSSQSSDELTKLITDEKFKIFLITKENEPVKYSVLSKELRQSIVILQLNFKDPKKISLSTEMDRIEVKIDKEIEYKSKEVVCFIPFDTKQNAPVPP